MMKRFDKEFEDKLEQTIGAVEEKTSAEVVVAIAPSSDAYVDTYFKGGLVLSFITLLYLLYAPLYFSEIFVPIIIAVTFALGALIVHFFPPIKALLISSKRKRHHVHREAYAYFLEKELTETMDRTALLVYISLLEKKCQLIPDKGVESAIPLGEWQELQSHFQQLFTGKKPLPQAIIETLSQVVAYFSEYLPPLEDNIDELPNRLRKA
jgi:putative membrane protein